MIREEVREVMQALHDENSSSSEEEDEPAELDAGEPVELDAAAVGDLNVAELRTELQARSKDTTGLKSELKARLIGDPNPKRAAKSSAIRNF